MASLSRSKAVLELGKRLVAQLDGKGDLLTAWMGHMVAERMHAAETAPPEAKAAAEEDCVRVILELWRHRDALPQRVRPLQELEPVLRTLQSLDVERDGYRYYRSALEAADVADAREDVRRWLDFAIACDYTARALIQFALRSAAGATAEQAGPWIELARAAGAEEESEGLLFELIFGNETGPEEEAQIASLKSMLSQLESFTKLAHSLAEDIRTRLSAAES
jgi:hypothetical protein